MPLSKEQTGVLSQSSQAGFTNNVPISQPDLAALENHKAYFQLDYVSGPENAKERMAFTAKLLLTLVSLYPVCGFFDASAQAYTPSSRLGTEMLKKTDITSVDLFHLFANVQTISGNGNIEIHTHGMDQFELPDIQVMCDEKDRGYYDDVLRNSGIYMIDEGRAMKPGDTGELAGDGSVFRVSSPKPDKQHPFGFNGAITLTRQE